MKKTISLALSIILLLALAAPCFYSIHDYVERNDVSRFCKIVSDINRKYNGISTNILYDEKETVNTGLTENRLIIKTKNIIKNTKAVDVVYGLDYAILQYGSKGDMLDEYDAFMNHGYTVEKDRIFSISDTIMDDSESSDTVLPVSDNYGYVNSGANYTKEILQSDSNLYDEIVVGIMDTGIDYNHKVFENRYVENRINFASSGDSDDPIDEQMHGTAVASMVVFSTPENVKVKPYKILNADGACTLTEVLSACEYIIAEKDKPDIVNMSFGGYSFDGEAEIEKDAVRRMVESGITVCVAAGNETVPAEYCTPGGVDEVITVSSHGSTNYISDYSCYGKAVDVCAPGEKIYCAKLGGGYTSEHSGTSFSSPITSAACACILMQEPELTPQQVKQKIKDNAISVGEDDSYYFGSGMVNFANLISDYKKYDVLQPSVIGGLYHSEQVIAFDSIPDDADIVYTTDRKIPSDTVGTKYTEPITISDDTLLIYALVSKENGRYLSNISSQEYIIQYYADESEFTIEDGVIIAATRKSGNIIVPDLIDGTVPTAVKGSVFMSSKLTGIVLPDSIKTLGSSCFNGSKKLKHIVAKGVTEFSGASVFSECIDLRDEVMPNLETVTESAFYKCTKLHKVDFGESLTHLKKMLFSEAGLIDADFPNATATEADESVFENCTLFTCNIPKIDILYKNMFYCCNYLHDLKTDVIKIIHSQSIGYCNYLRNLDLSNLEILYEGALDKCSLDTVYAPNIKKFTKYSGSSSTVKIGADCYCRVINLPSLVGKLSSKSLSYSYIEELYLNSITDMSSGALYNVPYLNIVYLPNVKNFYFPTASITWVESLMPIIYNKFKEKPPLEIVWIPKAEVKTTATLKETKFLFAPSTTSLTVDVKNENTQASIVLSDKITDGNLSVTAMGEKPVIISVDGTFVKQNAIDEDCQYEFVDADDCLYIETDETGRLVYRAGKNEFSVPLKFIAESWDNDAFNKSRQESFYQFLFDLTNDKFVNAKDYSVILKESKNQNSGLFLTIL